MSEAGRESATAKRGDDETNDANASLDEASAPRGAVDAASPFASAASIAAGFAANWFLGGLSGMALASVFPAEFPVGDPPVPTTLGLGLTTLAMGLNATVAGLLVGRLAPIAPVVHASVLAGLFGMFAMTGMDQAHGLPGWFALSFALVPPAGCVLGGALAHIGARRRATATASSPPRGEATTISSSDPPP